jgi:outer membrane lipoprotein-sorting protein
MLKRFLILITAAGAAHASAPGAAEILQQVDQYRMPVNSFEANVRIEAGKGQEPGTYVIRGANYNQVLVEATSVDQRGQKFLTTDSGLFFYAPRTRRAIRLTPLQTLLGKANIGDLSRIRFSHDYDASLLEAESEGCPVKACVTLDLRSRNEAATYSRITLLAARQDGRYVPLKAMLYVASGKLLKVATFDSAQGGLPPTTRYADPQLPGEETRVVFEKVRAAEFPANMFNPRALEQ